MKNKKTRVLLGIVLSFYTLLSFSPVSAYAAVSAGASAEDSKSNLAIQSEEYAEVLSDNVEVGSRIWELLFGKEKDKSLALAPGGTVFGVRIKQSYVSVADAKGIPALSAGDIILSINGTEIKCAEDVKKAVSASGGESVTIRARHKGEDVGIEVRPTLEDGEYKLGLTLRDGAAGIGTITFVDTETGFFGGLGHGICDGETGEVVDMSSGEVTGAILGGVHKGEVGKPGELTGILTDEKCGTLTSNNECGVFGYLSKIPDGLKTVRLASRSEVREGEAKIVSTLKNGKSAEYKIEILDINRESNGSKSFRIRVTDEALKAITGGIVRGMSGSPIIQDGKLVGAVTHVMGANPTEGYVIFIENMLNASQTTRNEVPRAA